MLTQFESWISANTPPLHRRLLLSALAEIMCIWGLEFEDNSEKKLEFPD